VRYGPIEATLDKPQGTNVWLTLGLREGKNREVRKILENLGLTVNRLIRISFGPFQLLDIKPGEVEHVTRSVLREQLGRQAASELGIADDDAARAPRKPKPPKPKGWA
jgi:23S rRNA pseudouridine2605 synthase